MIQSLNHAGRLCVCDLREPNLAPRPSPEFGSSRKLAHFRGLLRGPAMKSGWALPLTPTPLPIRFRGLNVPVGPFGGAQSPHTQAFTRMKTGIYALVLAFSALFASGPSAGRGWFSLPGFCLPKVTRFTKCIDNKVTNCTRSRGWDCKNKERCIATPEPCELPPGNG